MAFLNFKAWAFGLFGYLATAFEEDPNVLSIMRISVAVVIATACGIAIYFAVRGGVTVSETGLVVGMLTCGLGAKIWQKKYEEKKYE